MNAATSTSSSQREFELLPERHRQMRAWGANTLTAALRSREKLPADGARRRTLRLEAGKSETAVYLALGSMAVQDAPPPEEDATEEDAVERARRLAEDRERHLKWVHTYESIYIRRILGAALALMEGA